MRIKKKGTTGNAKNYITRTQAVRKLQISLPDFRRLCIFKGIYPREPRNKKKASRSSTPATTFYYAKDIQYLLHEPLLNKFREHKALAKKIGRALGRGEPGDAARLERSAPRMTLDHVIKERYPTFVDALRDLDDALSMLFLFANLPSTTYVAPKTIALCQRLCLEFEHYLIVSHSLRKSFLSIKGIYYQATVQGQDIMWLVPYKFVQRMVGDIDFRIMATFIEFYTTLLGFVNYRLYTTIGLVYPPKFDATSDEQGGELGAYKLEGKSLGTDTPALENGSNGRTSQAIASVDAQAEADRLAALPEAEAADDDAAQASEEQEDEAAADAIDTFELAATADADVLPQPEAGEDVTSTLFAPFTFFLSRETPRHPLEFVLKAFGCKRVGWDTVLGDGAFTSDEKDPNITHQIVDRPNLPANAFPAEAEIGENPTPSGQTRVAGRTYVQPQWVWDCINQGKLLRPDLYAPGATLPPHLSPWVKPKKGEYDPTAPLAEQENEGEAELDDEEAAEASSEEEEEEADEEAEAKAVQPVTANGKKTSHDALFDRGAAIQAGEGMDVNMADSASEESDSGDDFAGFEDAEPASEELSEGEEDALSYQRELEAEALGLNPAAARKKDAAAGGSSELRKKVEKKKREEAEEIERRKMMLPNRKRKLYEKMQYSNRVRDAEAEKLRKRRRKLERGGGAVKDKA